MLLSNRDNIRSHLGAQQTFGREVWGNSSLHSLSASFILNTTKKKTGYFAASFSHTKENTLNSPSQGEMDLWQIPQPLLFFTRLAQKTKKAGTPVLTKKKGRKKREQEVWKKVTEREKEKKTWESLSEWIIKGRERETCVFWIRNKKNWTTSKNRKEEKKSYKWRITA